MTNDNIDKLTILGDKIQALLDDQDEVFILGFVVLSGYDENGHGTADARSKLDTHAFREALNEVARGI